MTEEEIEKLIASYINEHNNKVMADFEGYSPGEMDKIIYHAFSDNSPVQLKELTDAEYRKVPLLNQIKYLMNVIAEKGELKLTNKGFLPTKVVADIYAQGFIKDPYIERGISKLYKEADVMSINLTRLLLEISGLIKKRNGKLSLTKEGAKIAGSNPLLMKRIFTIFGYKFNWAYYDGYGDNQIGQLGFCFLPDSVAQYMVIKNVIVLFMPKSILKPFRNFMKIISAAAPWLPGIIPNNAIH
ncbi:MAG: hypothetical protein U5L09_11000 [Bacteroidales bacterium]|nr:hypothetical protein [Bacteroidales bacterium]